MHYHFFWEKIEIIVEIILYCLTKKSNYLTMYVSILCIYVSILWNHFTALKSSLTEIIPISISMLAGDGHQRDRGFSVAIVKAKGALIYAGADRVVQEATRR